jgi:large subunit ribosomal protein L30
MSSAIRFDAGGGEASLEITQTRSLIGSKQNQRATLRSLGLRKVSQTVVQPDRPEIRGMVAKVAHLVTVRYAGSAEVVELEPGQEPKGEGAPAAGHAVPDDEVVALREAEADALAVPGSAVAGSVVVLPPGLTSTDAPDAPDAVSDASDNVRNTGVESRSDLPQAITAPAPGPPVEQTGPRAQQEPDREEAGAVDSEVLADPRGDLDDAVAAGDLPEEEAERFTQQETE